jgi:hypothetical protein
MWALWANGVPSIYLAQLGYQRVFAGNAVFPAMIVVISPASTAQYQAAADSSSSFWMWTGVANLALAFSILANTWFGYRYCRFSRLEHHIQWLSNRSFLSKQQVNGSVSMLGWAGWASVAVGVSLSRTGCDSALTDARSSMLYSWGWGLGTGASFYLCLLWIWLNWSLCHCAKHLVPRGTVQQERMNFQPDELKSQILVRTDGVALEWECIGYFRMSTVVLGVAVFSMALLCTDLSPLHVCASGMFFALLGVTTAAPGLVSRLQEQIKDCLTEQHQIWVLEVASTAEQDEWRDYEQGCGRGLSERLLAGGMGGGAAEQAIAAV